MSPVLIGMLCALFIDRDVSQLGMDSLQSNIPNNKKRIINVSFSVYSLNKTSHLENIRTEIVAQNSTILS